jgi:hypothetical protein
MGMLEAKICFIQSQQSVLSQLHVFILGPRKGETASLAASVLRVANVAMSLG